MLAVMVAMLLFITFVSRITFNIKKEVDTVTKNYSYRSRPEDPAVTAFVEAFFKKRVAEISTEDLKKVRYLSIKRENTETEGEDFATAPWLFVVALQTDEEGKPISPVEIRVSGTDKIEEEDMQVFSSLEVLNLNNDGDIKWQESYKGGNLQNLTELRYYGGNGSERPGTIAKLFKDDPASVKGLLTSPYLGDKEDLDALRLFSGLRVLYINRVSKEATSDFSFLASFPEIEELYLSVQSDSWDIAGLSALTKLKKLLISGYDVQFANISVLNGMPQLEELTLNNVKAIKDLDFVKNMPKLKKISVDSCGELRSIGALPTLKI